MNKFSLGLFLCLFSITLISEQIDQKNEYVTIHTSAGDIILELFVKQSPVTVQNFLSYVDQDFYDETIFHRVIQNFMIQGGGFSKSMIPKKTGEPIINESGNRLHNVRGTIAMARTSSPDSATAQFFINQRSNLRLDWMPGSPGYTVFGKVTSGMYVVDLISKAETKAIRGYENVPVDPIIIFDIARH